MVVKTTEAVAAEHPARRGLDLTGGWDDAAGRGVAGGGEERKLTWGVGAGAGVSPEPEKVGGVRLWREGQGGGRPAVDAARTGRCGESIRLRPAWRWWRDRRPCSDDGDDGVARAVMGSAQNCSKRFVSNGRTGCRIGTPNV